MVLPIISYLYPIGGYVEELAIPPVNRGFDVFPPNVPWCQNLRILFLFDGMQLCVNSHVYKSLADEIAYHENRKATKGSSRIESGIQRDLSPGMRPN